MSRTTDALKKLLVRITKATCCDDIQGNTMCEILDYGLKNLNVDENGEIVCKDYVEPSEPSVSSLTPFNVGDTIEKGTTYAFDKSKGEEVASLLNGLTYEIDPEVGIGIIDLLGTFTLDNGDREPTLVALSLNGANGLFVIDSDTYVPIYATGAIDYYVIKATQGWNIDGDTYTLLQTSRPSSIQSILETTPAWNGVLVGKKAPTFLYNLVPSEMTIQENNDGSRSYIKNIDGIIDNMLVDETYNVTFEVNGETFTRVGKVTEGNGMQILMNELGNGPIDIIGDTTDYIRYGHYLNRGLENEAPIEGKNAPFIITNGIYKDNTPTVKVISYTKQ